MRALDAAVLALLAPIALPSGAFQTYDGYVTVDNSGKTVEYPLPFLVYYSNLGDDHPEDPQNRRLGGGSFRLSKLFQLTYVGITPDQARLAGEKARDVLRGKRIDLGSGQPSWPLTVEESQRVRRDDDAIRPGGEPLFYGVDIYTFSHRTNHQGVLL